MIAKLTAAIGIALMCGVGFVALLIAAWVAVLIVFFIIGTTQVALGKLKNEKVGK